MQKQSQLVFRFALTRLCWPVFRLWSGVMSFMFKCNWTHFSCCTPGFKHILPWASNIKTAPTNWFSIFRAAHLWLGFSLAHKRTWTHLHCDWVSDVLQKWPKMLLSSETHQDLLLNWVFQIEQEDYFKEKKKKANHTRIHNRLECKYWQIRFLSQTWSVELYWVFRDAE